MTTHCNSCAKQDVCNQIKTYKDTEELVKYIIPTPQVVATQIKVTVECGKYLQKQQDPRTPPQWPGKLFSKHADGVGGEWRERSE